MRNMILVLVDWLIEGGDVIEVKFHFQPVESETLSW